MEIETTIAKQLRIAEEKANYDAACKRLLSEKRILAWIMKSCLDEYRDCEISEIAEQYIQDTPQISQIPVAPDESNRPTRVDTVGIEDATMTEGTVTYDIRFKALAPVSGDLIRLIINVEAQNDFYPGYPLVKRGIYYCSRMVSAQYGTEFTESHYEDIKKVYSLWVCMNPPKGRAGSITRYSIQEENLVGDVREQRDYYDLLTTVMICLGEEEEEQDPGVLKLLETLLSSEKDPAAKKKTLEEEFAIPVTQTLEREVSLMCNLSKGIEEKGIRKGMQKGMQKGIQQGMQEGMQKGMQKGIQEGTLLSIRSLMKSMNWTAEEAMTALQIEEPERSHYAERIEKEH